jgi:hypothetical protein
MNEKSLDEIFKEALHEWLLANLVNGLNEQLDNLKNKNLSSDEKNKKRLFKILINGNAKNKIESMKESDTRRFNSYLNKQTIDHYTEILVKLDTSDISRRLTSSFESILNDQLKKCKINRTETSKYLQQNLKTKMFMKSQADLDLIDLTSHDDSEPVLVTTAKNSYTTHSSSINSRNRFGATSSTAQQNDQDQSQILNGKNEKNINIKQIPSAHKKRQNSKDSKLNKFYRCHLCQYKTKYVRLIKWHSSTHSDSEKKAIRDNKCSTSPSSNSVASKTSKIPLKKPTHPGNGKFNCDQCGKNCYCSSNLARHILIHTGEKPFSCEQCQKRFSQQANLKTHMKLHTGERPFSCSICEKNFSQLSTLVKHKSTHQRI